MILSLLKIYTSLRLRFHRRIKNFSTRLKLPSIAPLILSHCPLSFEQSFSRWSKFLGKRNLVTKAFSFSLRFLTEPLSTSREVASTNTLSFLALKSFGIDDLDDPDCEALIAKLAARFLSGQEGSQVIILSDATYEAMSREGLLPKKATVLSQTAFSKLVEVIRASGEGSFPLAPKAIIPTDAGATDL